MSLFFFDEIFFFETVVLNIMACFPEMGDHPFDGSGTAAEIFCNMSQRPETVFLDQLKNIFQPFFIR